MTALHFFSIKCVSLKYFLQLKLVFHFHLKIQTIGTIPTNDTPAKKIIIIIIVFLKYKEMDTPFFFYSNLELANIITLFKDIFQGHKYILSEVENFISFLITRYGLHSILTMALNIHK